VKVVELLLVKGANMIACAIDEIIGGVCYDLTKRIASSSEDHTEGRKNVVKLPTFCRIIVFDSRKSCIIEYSIPACSFLWHIFGDAGVPIFYRTLKNFLAAIRIKTPAKHIY
jgi:hypothetical protein